MQLLEILLAFSPLGHSRTVLQAAMDAMASISYTDSIDLLIRSFSCYTLLLSIPVRR